MLETYLQLKCLDLDADDCIKIFDGALHDFFQDEEDRFADLNFIREVHLYLSSYSSWPTDYNGNKPSIMYQKISSDQIRVVIKADFEAFGGTSFESFSRELFAFLDFNPYMRYFKVIKESTYSIFSVYDKSETLRYLDFGLYATEEDLKESKFERKLSDDIYTLDELDDLIENGSITDYDGSGYLLRLNDDDGWTKSNLRMSVDSKVPKYARDHFTHFIWYNRQETSMILINLIYAVLLFIYGIILLKENDGKLTNFLAIVLLAVSVLGLIAIVAMELS